MIFLTQILGFFLLPVLLNALIKLTFYMYKTNTLNSKSFFLPFVPLLNLFYIKDTLFPNLNIIQVSERIQRSIIYYSNFSRISYYFFLMVLTCALINTFDKLQYFALQIILLYLLINLASFVYYLIRAFRHHLDDLNDEETMNYYYHEDNY
jgi:hypothetical protein